MKIHDKSEIDLIMLTLKKRKYGSTVDQIFTEFHGMYPTKIANKRQIHRYLNYANRYIDQYKTVKQSLYRLGLMELL